MPALPVRRNARTQLSVMTLSRILLAALTLLAGAKPAPATPAHDLYLCASINLNFVVGSKLSTLSGIYRRTPDGTFQHFGQNYPYIISLAVDPRDPAVIQVASLNGA